MDNIKADKGLAKPIREIFAERLRKRQSVRVNIKGDSMRPFIKKGDNVTVKPIKLEETRIGDIIVYSRSVKDDFAVHRLIQKRRDKEGRDFLFTKGDANIYGDSPVYAEDLYGKVTSIKRKDGKIINLETRFNRLLASPIACLSWAWATLREAIFYPSRFLKRVREYTFNSK